MTDPWPCRYGLFLTSLALSILFSEGWQGPLTCLVTLLLPPEIKAFGVSLWSAVANIIMPAGNVLFGIYLMVRSLVKPAGCLPQSAGCPAVQPITSHAQKLLHHLSRHMLCAPQTATLHLPTRHGNEHTWP